MDYSPDPDDLLRELAAEGAVRRHQPADHHEGPADPPQDHPKICDEVPEGEVCEATYQMRRRIIAQAAGEWISTRDGIKHLRYTHEDCIDRVIMTPGISQNDLAMLYGVTTAWMSIVMNCDAFRVRLAQRREELIDPALLASLNERYGALAQRSVEVLLHKLHQEPEKISDKLALEAAALGAKAMGLGEQKAPPGANAADHLAAIAHRLLDLNRPPPITVEAS